MISAALLSLTLAGVPVSPPPAPTTPLEAGAIFDQAVADMMAADPARWAGSSADPAACVNLVVTWDDGESEELWQCYASVRPGNFSLVYGELDAAGVPTGGMFVFGLDDVVPPPAS